LQEPLALSKGGPQGPEGIPQSRRGGFGFGAAPSPPFPLPLDTWPASPPPWQKRKEKGNVRPQHGKPPPHDRGARVLNGKPGLSPSLLFREAKTQAAGRRPFGPMPATTGDSGGIRAKKPGPDAENPGPGGRGRAKWAPPFCGFFPADQTAKPNRRPQTPATSPPFRPTPPLVVPPTSPGTTMAQPATRLPPGKCPFSPLELAGHARPPPYWGAKVQQAGMDALTNVPFAAQ